MRTLARAVPIVILIGLAIGAWSIVYYLIAVADVGQTDDFWAAERLAAYLLFILAPALTFLPIGRALRIPLYDVEAIAGWSTLAFAFTFVDPGTTPSLPALLILLVALVVSLATVFTLLSYAVGLRLFARRSQRYDFVRARREGYLMSIFGVGCLLLSSLGALSPISVALFGLIVFLLEIFLLSRGSPREARPRPTT